ncbi:Na(+)/H(+) exchange regulatory cofactor NHE-RF1 [Parasteatoda tepidariorum]|uniref:Na(+)/H(+) exchange regulatory cofactor NHE-RF2 n=1 Tax=Parasteatoda tepidariorum TaxID=114398 RepID=A0A2L2XXH6_PARTP|nr:Na(+)/H(+) exchange regulatory cofactor NHE-RF1 [Parasteatoda tepidariorum]
MSSELPANAPVPRVCHLIKWADFDGYGFNLHAEKSRTGQFIGKVDDDSPAQHAGLREGDRIIEVNGVNIANENHRQVVERIKSIPNETKLLVVDEEADKWYKERKIVIKSTLPNVQSMKTPIPRPYKEPPCYENISPSANGNDKSSVGNGVHQYSPETAPKYENKQNGTTSPHPAANGVTVVEKAAIVDEHEVEEESPKIIVNKTPESPIIQKTKEEVHNSRSSTPMDSNASIPDSPHSTKSSRSTNSVGGNSNQNGPLGQLEDGVLNLNMSASEMRQMLANRRKKDPKKEPMDIRQKYEIIQQM